MSDGTIFPGKNVQGDKIKGDNINYDTGKNYCVINKTNLV